MQSAVPTAASCGVYQSNKEVDGTGNENSTTGYYMLSIIPENNSTEYTVILPFPSEYDNSSEDIDIWGDAQCDSSEIDGMPAIHITGRGEISVEAYNLTGDLSWAHTEDDRTKIYADTGNNTLYISSYCQEKLGYRIKDMVDFNGWDFVNMFVFNGTGEEHIYEVFITSESDESYSLTLPMPEGWDEFEGDVKSVYGEIDYTKGTMESHPGINISGRGNSYLLIYCSEHMDDGTLSWSGLNNGTTKIYAEKLSSPIHLKVEYTEITPISDYGAEISGKCAKEGWNYMELSETES